MAGLERHGLGRDHVPPPQLDTVEAELARRPVERAFDRERNLRPPRTPIGGDRGRVREDRQNGHADRRRLVDARDAARIEDRRETAEEREVGAHAGIGERPQPQQVALLAEGQLGDPAVLARMLVGEQALAAVAGPFDRPAHLARGPEHQRQFGMDVAAHAEGAAHVARHHAQFSLGDLQDELRQEAADVVRALHAGLQRVAVVGDVVRAEGRARLHRVGRDPGDVVLVAHGVGGALEGRVDGGRIAALVLEADIVGRVRPDRRGAVGNRLADRDDRRQLVILDLDQLGRVARLARCLGHDEGDRVADRPHGVLRQGHARRHEHVRAVGAFQRHDHADHRRQQADAVRFQILAREDAEHAGRVRRLGGVDRRDRRMADGRAQDIAIRLIRHIEIVGVLPLADDQALVFLAQNGLTQAELHRFPAPQCSECRRSVRNRPRQANRNDQFRPKKGPAEPAR